jgi:hypothetical protein
VPRAPMLLVSSEGSIARAATSIRIAAGCEAPQVTAPHPAHPVPGRDQGPGLLGRWATICSLAASGCTVAADALWRAGRPSPAVLHRQPEAAFTHKALRL